jgi:hypothetical protein
MRSFIHSRTQFRLRYCIFLTFSPCDYLLRPQLSDLTQNDLQDVFRAPSLDTRFSGI